MTRPEPAWRKVACPSPEADDPGCGAESGDLCDEVTRVGDLVVRGYRQRPHAARKRAAESPPATRNT